MKWESSKPIRLEELTFIGAGRSEPSPLDPISENHDEAWAEDLYHDLRNRLEGKDNDGCGSVKSNQFF